MGNGVEDGNTHLVNEEMSYIATYTTVQYNEISTVQHLILLAYNVHSNKIQKNCKARSQ